MIILHLMQIMLKLIVEHYKTFLKTVPEKVKQKRKPSNDLHQTTDVSSTRV